MEEDHFGKVLMPKPEITERGVKRLLLSGFCFKGIKCLLFSRRHY
jgi:hypothetical protein